MAKYRLDLCVHSDYLAHSRPSFKLGSFWIRWANSNSANILSWSLMALFSSSARRRFLYFDELLFLGAFCLCLFLILYHDWLQTLDEPPRWEEPINIGIIQNEPLCQVYPVRVH